MEFYQNPELIFLVGLIAAVGASIGAYWTFTGNRKEDTRFLEVITSQK